MSVHHARVGLTCSRSDDRDVTRNNTLSLGELTEMSASPKLPQNKCIAPPRPEHE